MIQYPTFAAREGQKSAQKGALPVWSSAEVENTLPIPPPALKPQTSRAMLPPIRSGAERDSNHLTPSTPVRMITTCIAQNTRKAMKVCPVTLAQPPHAAVTSASRADPPSQVCIPNQPHATSARAIAAKFAPLTPNEALTKTGNGTPYFVPAWALRSIGMSTMMLPREIVSSACHQFIPAAISPEARRYVVMTMDIPIQSAAMLYVVHVRSSGPVGARSSLYRLEELTSDFILASSACRLRRRSRNSSCAMSPPSSAPANSEVASRE